MSDPYRKPGKRDGDPDTPAPAPPRKRWTPDQPSDDHPMVIIMKKMFALEAEREPDITKALEEGDRERAKELRRQLQAERDVLRVELEAASEEWERSKKDR